MIIDHRGRECLDLFVSSEHGFPNGRAELFQALKGPIVLWEFPINLGVAGRTDELGVGSVCKLPRDH